MHVHNAYAYAHKCRVVYLRSHFCTANMNLRAAQSHAPAAAAARQRNLRIIVFIQSAQERTHKRFEMGARARAFSAQVVMFGGRTVWVWWKEEALKCGWHWWWLFCCCCYNDYASSLDAIAFVLAVFVFVYKITRAYFRCAEQHVAERQHGAHGIVWRVLCHSGWGEQRAWKVA